MNIYIVIINSIAIIGIGKFQVLPLFLPINMSSISDYSILYDLSREYDLR